MSTFSYQLFNLTSNVSNQDNKLWIFLDMYVIVQLSTVGGIKTMYQFCIITSLQQTFIDL